MRLSVPLLERISEEQISLLGKEDHAGQLELARLVDRLRSPHGEESVARVKLVESHMPERAWRAEEQTHCKVQSAKCKVQSEEQRSAPLPQFDFFNFQFSIFNSSVPVPPRPLLLFPTPLALRVMVSPSHDAEGMPVSFTRERCTRWRIPSAPSGSPAAGGTGTTKPTNCIFRCRRYNRTAPLDLPSRPNRKMVFAWNE